MHNLIISLGYIPEVKILGRTLFLGFNVYGQVTPPQKHYANLYSHQQFTDYSYSFPSLAVLWIYIFYLGGLFPLSSHPCAPVKKAFILELFISTLCCLHWLT